MTVTRLFCLTQPAGELLKMNHWLVDIGDEADVIDGLLNGRSQSRTQEAEVRKQLSRKRVIESSDNVATVNKTAIDLWPSFTSSLI